MDDLTGAVHRRIEPKSRACSAAAMPAHSPAIPRSRVCASHPIPVLSAAGQHHRGAARGRDHGVGLVFDSLTTPARCRELVDAYRAVGGTAPCVLIRRAWVGEPPAQQTAQQLDPYRSYAPPERGRELGRRRDGRVRPTPPEVADRLARRGGHRGRRRC